MRMLQEHTAVNVYRRAVYFTYIFIYMKYTSITLWK